MSGIFDQIINYSPPLIVSGTVNYKGTWNASTNNPPLSNPPVASTKGDYYVVSTAGTQFSISFAVGDWIISSGTAWEKVDLTDAVSSVFGRTGAVVGVSTDYSAVGLTNTAIGASSPSTGAFTTVTASSTIAATGAVTGSNLSGTNTGDQTTITGNAGSATILQTARNINGVSFNGSADITVAAAAGTLTGNTLASGVTASSLTSVGTIASLVATTADINGGTIDGTTVGATTPSTVAATTGTFSGTISGTGDIVSYTDANAIKFGTTGSQGIIASTRSGGNYSSLAFKTSGTDGNGVTRLTLALDGSATFAVAGTTRAEVTSTGLAVTGALSSTTGANFATSSGNVGIGTTSPTAPLTVYGPGNSAHGTIRLVGGANNNTTNWQTITSRQYDTANESEGFVAVNTVYTATSNTLLFGGALEEFNAATAISFYTAANVSTRHGTERMSISSSGAVVIAGSLSKGSGSFRIEHPLASKSETHELVHSFIEGPQADLIYRGKVTLINGAASVNIDTAATMTEGTFEALCREVQCFTTNESGWTAIRGKVTGNILTIEAQDSSCTDEISWMVIGERKDKHMLDTEWTDDNGKVIVEPLKPVQQLASDSETAESNL